MVGVLCHGSNELWDMRQFVHAVGQGCGLNSHVQMCQFSGERSAPAPATALPCRPVQRLPSLHSSSSRFKSIVFWVQGVMDIWGGFKGFSIIKDVFSNSVVFALLLNFCSGIPPPPPRALPCLSNHWYCHFVQYALSWP